MPRQLMEEKDQLRAVVGLERRLRGVERQSPGPWHLVTAMATDFGYLAWPTAQYGYQNGWADATGSFAQPMRFRRKPGGYEVEGVAAGGTAGTPIFNLPPLFFEQSVLRTYPAVDAQGHPGMLVVDGTARSGHGFDYAPVSLQAAGAGVAGAWHDVGAAGEPPFQNSWVNAGGGLQVLRFRLITGSATPGQTIDASNACLEIQGSISGGLLGTVVFTLPDGYRPSAELRLPAVDAAGASCYFRVLTTGDVQLEPAGAGNATGISQITSSDGTITVTNPNGPIADLSAPSASGAFTKIADVTLSAAGSFDVSSIPATRALLVIYLQLRGDAAVSQINAQLTFNGDAGANYADTWIWNGSSSVSGGEDNAQNFVQLGSAPAATVGAPWAAVWRIEIPNYAGTTFAKQLTFQKARADGLATGNRQVLPATGVWSSTAAINRLSVVASSGNFVAGSRIVVYGG